MNPPPIRNLPAAIDGYGAVVAYTGHCKVPLVVTCHPKRLHTVARDAVKLLSSVDAALDVCAVADGAVLSFHHHLRNGDGVLNMVLDAAARRGLKNLTVAASSLFPVHAPLVEHIRNGVVTRIYTAYVSGPVSEAISSGELRDPLIMQTHGGRAAAIQSGRLHINVAFIAAPAADNYGNISGAIGPAACGPLGYAMADAEYADRVVAITDHLASFPVCPIDIHQDQVDFVVKVDSIGDPTGILSGTTCPTQDPVGLQIAATAASVIEASGLINSNFSFQTGAGGISLAVAQELAKIMTRLKVRGSFAAGGVTTTLCAMLESGLFRNIFDVQCFDLGAVESYRNDPRHMAMSASLYANPNSCGAMVNRLTAMILGAAEVDLDFNVNVTTGSTGRILGGSGGHADTADGAELAIVTTRLATGTTPKIVEQVRCITTPGSSIDVVVTEAGVAVNPRRPELLASLRAFGVRTRSIAELRQEAVRRAPQTAPADCDGRVIAVVEYRDGTVIDVVRATLPSQ